MFAIYLDKIIGEKKIDTIDHISNILTSYHHLDVRPDDILKTQNGKPYIKNGNVHFSLSHKFEYVATIVASRPVGIDIELITGKDKTRYADKLLSAQEKNIYNEKSTPEEKERFYLKVWTQKEAYIKQNGGKLKDVFSIDTTKINSHTMNVGDLILSFCI